MKTIQISNHKIGQHFKPFIVAEMSGNHNQSLNHALDIVNAVADAGADALKLQTYTPDTMTINYAQNEFFINDDNSLWKGQSLYDLYMKAYTPWEWHEPIFERCKERGILAFSSPFDASAVDFLETLDVPCYKIASFELVDLPLIQKVASTNKPIILSTGMANIAEISEAVQMVRETGNENIILLKCTSTYPALPNDTNLRTIAHMRDLFNCEVGISDHTMGLGVSVASVAFGVSFIEKHVTLDRNEGGVDSAFSLEPDELRQLVIESERAWRALGSISYQYSETEEQSLAFRRSIYVIKDIGKNEQLTTENIRVIRPGFGLKPKYFSNVLGKMVKKHLKRGMPLRWEDIL